MGVFKNDKKIIKIIASLLFELYRSTRKKEYVPPMTPSPVASLPGLSLILIQNFFNLVPLTTYGVVGVSAIVICREALKEFFNSQTETIEVQPQTKNPQNLPPIIVFPGDLQKKRILSLHLCCSYSIGQYVIFTQKNKNNLSPVHINRGEVGEVIEELEGWDHALVDFSTQIPPRFQKMNTKAIAEKSLSEGIVIFEKS